MSVDKIVMIIMGFSVLVGAADKLIGNKFGLGEKFDEGFPTFMAPGEEEEHMEIIKNCLKTGKSYDPYTDPDFDPYADY